MQLNSLDCPVCYEKYDLTIRLPRFSPVCGHTFCSQCILQLIKRSEGFKCPVCKKLRSHSSLDDFPPDWILRESVEKSLEFEFCKDHKKELQYICIEDKVKVCIDCALFGSHKKHDVKPLVEFKSKIEQRVQKLNELLKATKECHEKREILYQDKREKTIKTIQSRFRGLRFLLNAKEAEFMCQINSLYDQEIDRLECDIGENSLARRIMASKIAEYRQITKSSDPFKLLEEDFSEIWRRIQQALCPDQMDHLLEQINLDIDSTLRVHLSAFDKMRIQQTNFNLTRDAVEIHLHNKLSSRPELREYQPLTQKLPNFIRSSLTDITAIGQKTLLISYPFKAVDHKDFDISQEIGERITSIYFKISNNIERISQEDISKLCYIRSKLPMVQFIGIIACDYKLSEEALLDVFNCLFWLCESLTGVHLEFQMKGLFEKSILHLAETILPSIQHLNHIHIRLTHDEVTHKACNSLTQSISWHAEELNYLYYSLPCQDYSANSLQNMFVRMPNLKLLTFEATSKAFENKVLEAFVSNTLPSLKELQVFKLLIPCSTVTDLKVRLLFNSFPEEWFETLSEFRIALNDTQISDESLKDFVNKSLGKFKKLKDCKIQTENTNVSPGMKDRISKWEKTLSKKNLS